MLFVAPPLGPDERRVLEETAELHRRLHHLAGEPRRWSGSLRKVAFAVAVQSSNTIEGYTVTLEQALEAERDDEVDPETWHAVAGYRDALTYILQLADDPHVGLGTDLLRSLHFLMCKHELEKRPGRWREGPVYVRDERAGRLVYEGAPAEDVPALMEELAGRLAEAEAPPLVAGAMAHLDLVMIHPFKDGNGRMARAVQTLVLAREGILGAPFCSIEEYLGANTRDYYDVLAAVGGTRFDPTRDARPWLRFCLTAHWRQAQTLLRRARLLESLWDLVEVELLERDAPERALPALAEAARGLTLRRSTYRTLADVEDATATRDLRALVQAGLLVPSGEKRGRVYAASAVLRGLADELRRSLPSRSAADPFGER
jgi:Fic family protein